MRCAIQAVAAALLLSGRAEIWHLAVLFALHSTASAFFNPAATALIPQVAPAERLQQANALLSVTRSVSFGIGAALGGALVSIVSTGGAIAIDAGTFVVSAVCLAALGAHAAPAERGTRFLRELRAGFDEVRRHRWLWMGMGNASLFLMLVVAPFELIGPIVSKNELGGAFSWGVIQTGFAVGMLLGSLVMLRVRLERPMFVAGLLFFVTCVAPLLLALPGPVWSIALAYVGEGIAVGIFLTAWETAMQSHVPSDMLARVGAWDWLGQLAGMPLGYALTGPVVGAVGASATLVGVAVAAFLLSLVLRAQPRPARVACRRSEFCKGGWSSGRIGCIVTNSWRSPSRIPIGCGERAGVTLKRSGSSWRPTRRRSTTTCSGSWVVMRPWPRISARRSS